jgi:hypothetical protein
MLLAALCLMSSTVFTSANSVELCLVKTKSTFEINNLKKRDVTMLHAIWLGEIAIRQPQANRATLFLNCELRRTARTLSAASISNGRTQGTSLHFQSRIAGGVWQFQNCEDKTSTKIAESFVQPATSK